MLYIARTVGNTCWIYCRPHAEPSARPLCYYHFTATVTIPPRKYSENNSLWPTGLIVSARARASGTAWERTGNGGPRTSALVSKTTAVYCAEATSLLLLTCRRRCACTNKDLGERRSWPGSKSDSRCHRHRHPTAAAPEFHCSVALTPPHPTTAAHHTVNARHVDAPPKPPSNVVLYISPKIDVYTKTWSVNVSHCNNINNDFKYITSN